MRIVLVGVFIAVLASGCSCSSTVLISSRPCPTGSGTYELWCAGIENCEYRIPGGPTITCGRQDGAECLAAADAARLLCGSATADAPLPFDGGRDAPPLPPPDSPDAPIPCARDQVDLLILVDNSSSMAEEQALFGAELPRLVRALSAYSLHVGIISSDMGAGPVPPGVTVPSCNAGLGDDGMLLQRGIPRPGCAATFPSRVFEFAPGDDATMFASDVACVASLGTGGCGFEQQLEAMLKAVSPRSPTPFVASFYSPPAFFGGTFGHGDGTSSGFLRAGSVLALVPITEEDCSVPEYNIFYPDDPVYAGNPLNLRCSRFGTALYPVERYVEGFLQLRENPRRLLFAPIVGVPVDLAGGAASHDEILADPRMIEIEDSGIPPSHLLPSCSTPTGSAFPPRRIVTVAQGLERRGARTSVHSICAGSYGSAIDAIGAAVLEELASCP